jgi:hypothetical protein
MMSVDRTDPVWAAIKEARYYTMPRYEVFQALAPEQSQALKPSRYSKPPKLWSLPRPTKDGDVAVHARALDGPTAGVAKHWRLHRCRIVWQH